MNPLVIALMAMMVLFSGCASSGGASSSVNNGGLPEIAADNEPTYEPLPDMVAAE